MNIKLKLGFLSLMLCLALLIITDISVLESASLSFSLYSFIIYLYFVGKRINVLELVVFVFSMQLLFMPVLTFFISPGMMVLDSDEYLSYNLPAVLFLYLGLEVSIYKLPEHELLLENVKKNLNGKSNISVILFFVGFLGTILSLFAPLSMKRIVDMFATSLYISVLYSYYSNGRYKYLILSLTLLLMVVQTIREGMFNHFFYWGLLWISFITVGKKFYDTVIFKMSIVLIGIFFIAFIQSIKFEYRQATWGDNLGERRADPKLMQDLVIDRLTNLDKIMNINESDLSISLMSFSRLNEGHLVAQAMWYVPRFEPYADGELLLHFFYPFVPRLFWPDKPKTGGYDNMKRYTNVVNSVNTSTNISPVGEAYVNFGSFGGVIFMFLYGVLFSFFFRYIVKLSEDRPTLILWIPSLFVGLIIGSETDVLTTWGTFVTASIFLIVFLQILRRFNIDL